MLVKGQNGQWGVKRTDTWLRLLSLTWYGYKCILGSCLFDIFLNVSFPIKFNWSAAIPSCLSNESYNRVKLSLLAGFDMIFTGGISAEGFRKLIPALLASHNIITVKTPFSQRWFSFVECWNGHGHCIDRCCAYQLPNMAHCIGIFTVENQDMWPYALVVTFKQPRLLFRKAI